MTPMTTITTLDIRAAIDGMTTLDEIEAALAEVTSRREWVRAVVERMVFERWEAGLAIEDAAERSAWGEDTIRAIDAFGSARFFTEADRTMWLLHERRWGMV